MVRGRGRINNPVWRASLTAGAFARYGLTGASEPGRAASTEGGPKTGRPPAETL
jgi:hypothetical protein